MAEYKIRVYMDGDQWCATLADFINVQESPCEFADTPGKAVDKLIGELQNGHV